MVTGTSLHRIVQADAQRSASLSRFGRQSPQIPCDRSPHLTSTESWLLTGEPTQSSAHPWIWRFAPQLQTFDRSKRLPETRPSFIKLRAVASDRTWDKAATPPSNSHRQLPPRS